MTLPYGAVGWSAVCDCGTFPVLKMYCYYKCSVTLPHGAMGWPAVCDCGTFPNHTYLLFDIIIRSVIYDD